MFRRFYVQKVLYSEGPMFRRFYVQKVLYSEGVFLLSTRAQGHLINSELLSSRYFTTPSIPKCVAWGHSN